MIQGEKMILAKNSINMKGSKNKSSYTVMGKEPVHDTSYSFDRKMEPNTDI
jgi:hypothetical protein